MTRLELIDRITERMYKHSLLSQQDIYSAVSTIINQMSETLTNDGRVEIRGFGSFSLHHHNARKSRNPKTGESIDLIAKSRVHFKPGMQMRNNVNTAMKKSKRDAVTQKLMSKSFRST